MTQEVPVPRASQSLDPPDKCPSCNAALKAADVPVPGTTCPHCGFNLEAGEQHPTGSTPSGDRISKSQLGTPGGASPQA